MLLENLIPITLLVLIACAIFLTIFIGIQAKKISNAYLHYVEFKDADENKPTLIRISDDYEADYIINTQEIVSISINKEFYKENEEVFTINIIMYNNNSYVFRFVDEYSRDNLYNALATYYINDEQD